MTRGRGPRDRAGPALRQPDRLISGPDENWKRDQLEDEQKPQRNCRDVLSSAIVGGGLIVRCSAREPAQPLEPSVAVTVRGNVPVCVGVPVSMPAVDSIDSGWQGARGAEADDAERVRRGEGRGIRNSLRCRRERRRRQRRTGDVHVPDRFDDRTGRVVEPCRVVATRADEPVHIAGKGLESSAIRRPRAWRSSAGPYVAPSLDTSNGHSLDFGARSRYAPRSLAPAQLPRAVGTQPGHETLSRWIDASESVRRPMRLRAVVPVPPPPSVVKVPPTRIFPSGCTARAWTIAVRARIEDRVERAVGMQPADAVARRRAGAAATERREGAADQDLPVGLHRQGLDGTVRAGIEARVERAVGVEPPDPVARRRAGAAAAERREVAADQDLPVGLHRQGVDDGVGARVEGGVERAVGVEPPDVVARRRAGPAAAQHREAAADQDLPVRLHRQGADEVVRAGIEGRVERAVGVEPADSCCAASCRSRRRPAS